MSIPEFLYRGDSDPKRERRLHELYNPDKNGGYSSSGLLTTNLNNSGNGKEIFDTPFHELVQQHVMLAQVGQRLISFPFLNAKKGQCFLVEVRKRISLGLEKINGIFYFLHSQ